MQPLSSSLDTSTPSQTSQSLVQSILAGVFTPTAYKPSREDLQLTSVARLRSVIEREERETTRPRDTLRKSVFVACVRGCRECLAQFQTKLLLLNVSALLWGPRRDLTRSEELFYQIAVFHFGCFFSIAFTDLTLCVDEMVARVAEKETVDSLRNLRQFQSMFEDYFSIRFVEEDGKLFLRSLPLLLHDYQPYYGYLPCFLYRLATAVDYSDEDRCLEGIAREVARFYSFLPEETQAVESEEWENVVQCVLYPNLKKLLLLSDRLWTNGTIQVIATTDRLYRVFERCCLCLFLSQSKRCDASRSQRCLEWSLHESLKKSTFTDQGSSKRSHPLPQSSDSRDHRLTFGNRITLSMQVPVLVLSRLGRAERNG